MPEAGMNTRREFLTAAAAATSVRMAYGQAQNRKLKLGLIGCGWYGMVDLNAAFKAGNVEVVALADVDSKHLEASAAEVEKLQGSRPKTMKDYRELIDTPGLDAVFIATPPHWHALQFIAACRKGLNIYCEKPLAYDIREGRAMVNAAKKAGNIVQIGFQRRQPNGYQAAREYIQSGAPGRIVNVDAQIHYKAALLDNKPQDPPATLDWDAWCGPAPKLPYSPQIGHRSWRLEREYGNGHMVDWGIHVIDAARVILGESTLKAVTAAGGTYEYTGRITTPDTLTAHFEFEKCPITWKHRLWGAVEPAPDVQNGLFFYGEKETVFATDGRWMIIPRGKPEDRKSMTVTTDREAQVRHVANFLDGVRAKTQPVCQPEDAYQSAVTVQLGMISFYTGSGRIVWDSKTEQIAGNPAASKLLKREYRAPYKHPA
jgi:predicted dehydrogenase